MFFFGNTPSAFCENRVLGFVIQADKTTGSFFFQRNGKSLCTFSKHSDFMTQCLFNKKRSRLEIMDNEGTSIVGRKDIKPSLKTLLSDTILVINPQFPWFFVPSTNFLVLCISKLFGPRTVECASLISFQKQINRPQ